MMIPVDALLPKTRAKIVTIIIPIPFSPDFDIPNKKDAIMARLQSNVLNESTMNYLFAAKSSIPFEFKRNIDSSLKHSAPSFL